MCDNLVSVLFTYIVFFSYVNVNIRINTRGTGILPILDFMRVVLRFPENVLPPFRLAASVLRC